MSVLTDWKPSAGIRASAALHLAVAAGLVLDIPWPAGAGVLVINHAGLTLAGLWPRSTLLGKNLSKLPVCRSNAARVAITIDDGPDPEVTPLVLNILDETNSKASFFCVGSAVLANPILAREIIQRGHTIENHSFSHRHFFSLMGIGSLRKEINRAQHAIADTTGYIPVYFRAPAGLRNPLLDPVLQSLDLKLVSWTRRGFDTINKDPAQILDRLESKLEPDDILLLHDGNCAISAQGKPVILEVLPKLLVTLKQRGFQAISLPS